MSKPEKDAHKAAYKKFVKVRRQMYFGWLFGDSKRTNDEGNMTETPRWFKKSSPDDIIEAAYTEIVRELLPEYILIAGGGMVPTNFEKGDSPDMTEFIDKEIDFPSIGETKWLSSNASPFKESKKGFFGFYNLKKMEVDNSIYCTIQSVADSMSTCSSAASLTTQLVYKPMCAKIIFNENNYFMVDMRNAFGLNTIGDWLTTDMARKYEAIKNTDIPGIVGIKAEVAKYQNNRDSVSEGWKMIIDEFRDIQGWNGKISKKQAGDMKEKIMHDLYKHLYIFNLRLEAYYNNNQITGYDGQHVDLKSDSPFMAGNTWFALVGNMFGNVSTVQTGRELYGILLGMIDGLMRLSVAKCIGDVGQELEAAAKWSGASQDMWQVNSPMLQYAINLKPNDIESKIDSNTRILNYDGKGDSFRTFLANDRPSAWRSIFLTTQSININQKLVTGYYSGPGQEYFGKNFLVKGEMVIPGQLPQYYTQRWDAHSNKRAERKKPNGETMKNDDLYDGPPNQAVLGYNKSEFQR